MRRHAKHLDFAVLIVTDVPNGVLTLNTDSTEPTEKKVPLHVFTFDGPDSYVEVENCTTWKLTGDDAEEKYIFKPHVQGVEGLERLAR